MQLSLDASTTVIPPVGPNAELIRHLTEELTQLRLKIDQKRATELINAGSPRGASVTTSLGVVNGF